MPQAPRCTRSAGAAGRARPASGRRAAFTLIEIMAVVVIIGLLSGIVGYAVFSQVDKGYVTAAQAQMKTLEGALELYRMDNARYPTSEQGLQALVERPTSAPEPRRYPEGGYLRESRVPRDPWGNPYQYESPGANNPRSFDLWSFGADGQAGGSDTDADIGNWVESEA